MNRVHIQRRLDFYTPLSLVVGILLSSALILLVVPFPRFLLDALVVSQWLTGIVLLGFVWSMPHYIRLESLPKWLIGVTLARLCVNIATTRSILGYATGGGVVDRAGELMMGDRWIVGVVFFFGLLCVQYIVIARGLERIAQLTARFNLEAFPGAQQAISLEQDRGYLHPEKARRMRLDLEERSLRSSAVEGVLKFIKGEQVASLCLILINLVGGACIGYYHENLSVEKALSLYGQLAVGDGLLAQLPALYCSLATTIYVTRLLGKKSGQSLDILNDEIPFITFKRAIFGAAVGLCIVALLPLWEQESQYVIFIESLLVIVCVSLQDIWLNHKSVKVKTQDDQLDQNHVLGIPSMSISLSPIYIEKIGGVDHFKAKIEEARCGYGLPQRECSVHYPRVDLAFDYIALHINGELVAKEQLMTDYVFTLYHGTLEHGPIHPKLGIRGVWREKSNYPEGLSELSQIDWLIGWIMYHWRSHESFSWTVDEVWNWLNTGSATLVAEALEHWSSPVEMTDIVRELSSEGCAFEHPNRFLEGLVRAPKNDIDLNGQRKTSTIRRSIGLRALLGGQSTNTLGVVWIDYPTHLYSDDLKNVEMTELSMIAAHIKACATEWIHYEGELVVMVDEKIRRPMQKSLSLTLPGLRVLSPLEVPNRVQIETLKVIKCSEF